MLLVKVTSALLYARTQPPKHPVYAVKSQSEDDVDTDPLLNVSPEKET